MPIIPATLRFGEGPPLQRRVLIDSGSEVAGISLDCALRLGMQPWQMASATIQQIDGQRAPVCLATEGLTVGIDGFAPREIPVVVDARGSRSPRAYETLGRRSLFASFTLLFEESRAGPRVVFIEPGETPFHLPLSPVHTRGPAEADGWVTFPYVRSSDAQFAQPVVKVRLWRKVTRSVEVPMLVDTGAGLTVIPTSVAKELELPLWRMPKRPAARHDGSLYDSARGVGVTLNAQIGDLPSVTLPFMVVEGAGTNGYLGNLGCPGVLDQYRIVFHHQEGRDRVTFLDAQKHPPS